ncbi:anthranilate phosphoribosyltransferase [Limibacillus halophilus]
MTDGTNDLKPLIAKVAGGTPLSAAEAEEAFGIMMSGKATPSQIGGFLMALRVRGETVEEITGAARAMRAKMETVKAPAGAIDTCGTGGDGAGTLNISTAIALVVAACGVPVAKHGNRAASSKSGAADVLGALGVNLDAEKPVVERTLAEVGTAFLIAPRYHSAMRHVGPSRMELGTRTIFNLLGPLCNPAGVKRQVMGVFSDEWLVPLAEVLRDLGSERVWLVHGDSGLDEISITGPTKVAELKDGEITTFEVTPEDAGLPRHALSSILGGTGEENADALKGLLNGAQGGYRDIVLLGSAAALHIADKAGDLKEGASLAAQAIDSGAALGVLQRMIALSQEGAAS